MLEARYTIQPEDEQDGLEGIAQKLYGISSRWIRLFEANPGVIGNNPSVIKTGQQLTVPGLQNQQSSSDLAFLYIVQPRDLNDGLAGIAQRLYTNQNQWRQIYAINQGTIGNDPACLQIGQCLIILPWQVTDARRPGQLQQPGLIRRV